MSIPHRSENSYINNDIIPLLNSSYGYPIHDANKVRINDVPIFKPSGGKTSSSIDIVYYYNDEPLLLVEAKTIHKTHKAALGQALSYVKNFPSDKPEYSKSGKRPKYLATTVGSDIEFYKWEFDYEAEDFKAIPCEIIPFHKLLRLYGLSPGYKPVKLTVPLFKSDFFDELIDIFLPLNAKITSEVIKKASEQILMYLWDKDIYTGQKPYIDLKLHKQQGVRDLLNKYNLLNSIGPELAREYRKIILRAFQGGGLNQYLTEQCIIDFMVSLTGKVSKNASVLDFECGSGGFLAAAVEKFNLPLKNIKGIDIDELPYITAKTYLAIYFKIRGREKVDEIPVTKSNGLFNYGSNWEIIIGNPAGNKMYRLGNIKKILKDGLKNLKEKTHTYSEYELSIQQAIRSAKPEGKICLLLTESFFSNSNDEFLRRFAAENCRIKAIISLPRGVFSKGTPAKQGHKGSKTATMKMSILFSEKLNQPINLDKMKINLKKLDYPVFLASIKDPKHKNSDICKWLKPELDIVLKEWNNKKNSL